MLPEAGLLLAGMLLPFVAMCVMVGMTFSLRAKGVMQAVGPTVATLGGLALFGGFCGWTAAESIPLVGPVINAFSPVTNLAMIVMPWDRVSHYAENPSLGRASLAAGAIVAAAGYSLVVYALLSGMVNHFDQAVRQDGESEEGPG